MLRLILALVTLACAARAQHVNLQGALVDPVGTVLTLDDATPHSIRYSFPRVSSGVLTPTRLQSVLPLVRVNLSVAGEYEAVQPTTWFAYTGFEAWWSLGSPAATPNEPNAWGGIVYGYAYSGERATGAYVGAGGITTVDSHRYVDPVNTRELRAFVGQGSIDLYLNVRRVVEAFASAHWTHETTVRVQPTAETPCLSFYYAEPHEPVYRHTTGAWSSPAWSWSARHEVLNPMPGASSIAFPPDASGPGHVSVPGLGGSYSDVLVQTHASFWTVHGVEVMSPEPTVCGGTSTLFGRVNLNNLGAHNTSSWSTAVGSGGTQLSGHDGALDWAGGSGLWRAGSGYGHLVPAWLVLPSAETLQGEMRVRGVATFRPEELDARVAWAAIAGGRVSFRMIGRRPVQ